MTLISVRHLDVVTGMHDCECPPAPLKYSLHTTCNLIPYSNCHRDVVSVSTSRSRDGLKTHFPNVSVSSRTLRNVGTSRSRLRLKVKRLGLGPQGLVYKWHFSHILKENWMISLHSNYLPSLLNFRSKYLKVAFKPLTNNNTNYGA